jgi:hypothetical protein
MCGAFAGKRFKAGSIGVGATGAPRPWLFQATDARGVRERSTGVPLEKQNSGLGQSRTAIENETP